MRQDLLNFARQLAEEDDAAHDLWTWLPTHAVAEKRPGDYASSFQPSNRDVMREASMYLAHPEAPRGAADRRGARESAVRDVPVRRGPRGGKAVMQVASVSTSKGTVRSEIHGWTFEDARLLVKKALPSKEDGGKIFIGYTPSPKDIPFYGCVLEMLADGWKLLGPPQEESWTTDEGKTIEQWVWWLQRTYPRSDR